MGNGHNYIYIHIDDFKVVAKDPHIQVDRITSVLLVKEDGPLNYYLGNDHTYHYKHDMWTYSYKTYATDDVACVERLCVCLPNESTPFLVTECHP